MLTDHKPFDTDAIHTDIFRQVWVESEKLRESVEQGQRETRNLRGLTLSETTLFPHPPRSGNRPVYRSYMWREFGIRPQYPPLMRRM